MQELKLTLTVEEVNRILDALGDKPFQQVFKLIEKIQQQASEQITANTNDAAQKTGGGKD